jgi:hypothetical protein
VRWFYEGSLPPAVLEWFQRDEPEPEVQPRRLDYYFHIAGVDSLGIKLREGRIELKQRELQWPNTALHKRVHGVLEQWCKWGFGLADPVTSLAATGVPASVWIGVEKKRIVRRYDVSGNCVRAAGGGEYPGRGCVWELTEIGISGRPWWSLGLEAYGGEEVREDLVRVAQHLLVDGEPPTLRAEDSFSYPELLEMLGRRAGQSKIQLVLRENDKPTYENLA